MKWRSVKHLNTLIVLLLLLTSAAGYVAWKTLFPPQPVVRISYTGRFQLGFYDLMSLRSEIYNAQIRAAHTTLFSDITSPDDASFVFKGKFTQTLSGQGKLFYTLSPIYCRALQKGLMINGLMDLLMNTRFWMMPVETPAQSLAVGQTGAIIIYPPR